MTSINPPVLAGPQAERRMSSHILRLLGYLHENAQERGTCAAHAGADLEEPVRAETPDAEDRRFQDDDGTWYIWDALLRKFVEEVICLTM